MPRGLFLENDGIFILFCPLLYAFFVSYAEKLYLCGIHVRAFARAIT